MLAMQTPLLPVHAKGLIDAGFKVTIERSDTRCVADAHYEAAGCRMVAPGTWPLAPPTAIILGACV